MAIEDAALYILIEAPAMLLARVLRRYFPLTPRQANDLATILLLALIVGLCWVAWILYQSRHG